METLERLKALMQTGQRIQKEAEEALQRARVREELNARSQAALKEISQPAASKKCPTCKRPLTEATCKPDRSGFCNDTDCARCYTKRGTPRVYRAGGPRERWSQP